MDYIDELKKQHIKFEIIGENEALEIMHTKYSYYKLFSYAILFDKYQKGENEGMFVNLEFAHLYYLAEIDSRIAYVLMYMCLQIEEVLKAKLLSDIERFGDTKEFLIAYYYSDREYLEKTYVPDNNDFMQNYNSCESVLKMKCNEFLEAVQFGTLERMIRYFYQEYSNNIYDFDIASFEARLSSVRRIRNIAAHNNSIINKLTIKTDYKDLKISSFLGKNGIRNRTLQTNMSKQVIIDLCGLFDIFFVLIDSKELLEKAVELDNYIQSYKKMFENNDILKSSYNFIKKVFLIYCGKYA